MKRLRECTPTLSANAYRQLHIVLAWFWLLISIPVILTAGLRNSVPLLVFISIYANVASHWAAAAAARVEQAQEPSPESEEP
jgi:hypothetical protein